MGKRNRTHPGKQVENDAAMFKKLEEELRAARSEKPRNPPKKEKSHLLPIGRCAYCGKLLYHERSFHWMIDEDGQRVRKCNDEIYCRKVRREIAGQAESFHRAATKFNRPGREKWIDFCKEKRNDRDE